MADDEHEYLRRVHGYIATVHRGLARFYHEIAGAGLSRLE